MPTLKKPKIVHRWITRRWINARPGSVLILVIALLVLLALIGTAYLSSTQTERYTSQQNTINTEADLLIQGMVQALSGQITNGVYGSVNGVSQYRPPTSEQPYEGATATPITVAATGFSNYVSAFTKPNTSPQATDADPSNLFLGDRTPTLPTAAEPVSTGNPPIWTNISWPLFKDTSSENTFDSPLNGGQSYHMGMGSGRANFKFQPTSTTAAHASGTSTVVPALSMYATGGYYNPDLTTPPAIGTKIYAADTDGDGIADALFSKVPVGQINGVTYYVATRVLDGNSAINASSAFTQGVDNQFGLPTPNFGFFRSNIGLYELLNPLNPVGTSPDVEMNTLNKNRYGVVFSGGATPSSSIAATPNASDPAASGGPTNFVWYSYGDVFENTLTRRPGNPGYVTGGASQSYWLGQNATAALAYKFALYNTNVSPTLLEQALYSELYTSARTTPYSPDSAIQWYTDQFSTLNNFTGAGSNTGPLRTVLTGNNAVSNAVPTRLGNSTSTPPIWNLNTARYNFGDWVTDGTSPSTLRSYLCIQQHVPTIGSRPGIGTNVPGAVAYWAGVYPASPPATIAPGVPFTQQATKISVNTATFEQLWVGFAQVMTDSVATDPLTSASAQGPAPGATPQWQPPMQQGTVLAGTEPQMGMFRSTFRTPQAPAPGRTILTASQMLQLRAAIAAVNTLDLRDSDDDVSSRELVLTDGTGTPQYDVEVYGTEKQPYISEVVIQTDGTAGNITQNNYIALEICNPYPTPIILTNWQIGSLNRTTFASGMTLQPGLVIPTLTVPAATGGVPGLLILEDGTRPKDVDATIKANQTAHPAPAATAGQTPTVLAGLFTAAISATAGANQPQELFLMRPRRADGALSTSSVQNNDVYNEGAAAGINAPAANLADMVPVDQLDLTGLTIPAAPVGPPGPPPTGPNMTPATRFTYRRANDGTTTPNPKSWQFIYPGYYDPTGANPQGPYFTGFNTATKGLAAIQMVMIPALTGVSPPPIPPQAMFCNLAAPTGAGANNTQTGSTYQTVPIELNNAFMAGPNPVAAGNTFPFGAFARQVDMLQIPFIGAYRIRPIALKGTASATVTELNSVTIDSALANDNSPTGSGLLADGKGSPGPDAANTVGSVPTVFNEQIGRFCPIGDPTAGALAQTALDFGAGYASGALANLQQKVYWHYHWARRLFDYFTVQSPQDDYYPNYDPAQLNGSNDVAPVPPIVAKYPGGVAPTGIANNNATTVNGLTAGLSEDTVGVEGLININTAPMPVLAQLPFTTSVGGNVDVAKLIVAYRTSYGPFRSILDLYHVLQTSSANTSLLAAPAGPVQGLFSPGGIGTGAVTPPGTVRYDFQERFLLLNNVSNLITTRSDTFTCYILLQGWRNVGSANPTLVVQRRAAFLLDRGSLTPVNNQPTLFRVPTD